MRIAIIGAGAAGCICARECKRLRPAAEVTVYEAGKVPLAKVAVTGGGRCNIANTFAGIGLAGKAAGRRELREVYPRGYRLMQKLLHDFGPEDTVRWFAAEGVRLKEEDGGRLFPVTDDARTVVNALLAAMKREGVHVLTGKALCRLTPPTAGDTATENHGQWQLSFKDGSVASADAVVICAGGMKAEKGASEHGGFLQGLGIDTVPPVPSLFTFNIPDRGLRELMGTTVRGAAVKLAGTRLETHGDILITHWGLSGPAVLRLSSYAARELAARGYKADICVRWMADSGDGETGQPSADAWIKDNIARYPARQCTSVHPDNIPSRLWEFLLQRAALRPDLRWGELGSKGAARLAAVLSADTYHIDGQTRFREEFVTCGGVALSAVHADTLESRRHPGLYFAGEILDIDAVTGGFNLQAAWTTGITAARGLAAED